jgi:hypothetical protein
MSVRCTSASGSAGFPSQRISSPWQRFDHGSVRSTTHGGARSSRRTAAAGFTDDGCAHKPAVPHRQRLSIARGASGRLAPGSLTGLTEQKPIGQQQSAVGATAPPPRTTPLAVHGNAGCLAISSEVRAPDGPCHPTQRAVRGIAPVYIQSSDEMPSRRRPDLQSPRCGRQRPA